MPLTSYELNRLQALRAKKAALRQPKFRSFANITAGHNKFWRIGQLGDRVTSEWGVIGTPGQRQVKDLGSYWEAQYYIQRKIAEKLRGGYEELV